MIKVLHIQGRMGLGGAETFLMNNMRNIDQNKIQFNFLVYNDYRDTDVYFREIKQLGGKVYFISNPNKNIFKYYRELKKIIKKEKFDIVHNHVFYGGALNLSFIKSFSSAKLINHSHATESGKPFLKRSIEPLFRIMNRCVSHYNFACSGDAGIALYKNQKFTVINNGIDLEKYLKAQPYQSSDFTSIENPKLILHIGRFEEQKNHRFLIDIIYEATKIDDRLVFLLVGEGKLFNEIVQKVETLKLGNNVRFLKSRLDIDRLLASAEMFILPSLYEGLPIVSVEAQAAGLPLILADTITKEVDLIENSKFLPIDDVGPWVEELTKKHTKIRNEKQLSDFLKHYDIREVAKELELVYTSLV